VYRPATRSRVAKSATQQSKDQKGPSMTKKERQLLEAKTGIGKTVVFKIKGKSGKTEWGKIVDEELQKQALQKEGTHCP